MPGTAVVYSCRGIHVRIKQLVQKDDELPRVGIADDSRNALKWSFCDIATQRWVPKAALSYFISPFVKPPLSVRLAGMANTRVATPTLPGSRIATIRKKEWTAASRTLRDCA